jgi:hypothetical protein
MVLTLSCFALLYLVVVLCNLDLPPFFNLGTKETIDKESFRDSIR